MLVLKQDGSRKRHAIEKNVINAGVLNNGGKRWFVPITKVKNENKAIEFEIMCSYSF